MRLIDADAFAEFLKDTVKRQKYEDTKIDGLLTVADVIEAVISELDGTSFDGFKNAPTVQLDSDTISRQETLNAIQKHFNPTGAELSPDLASVLAGVGVVINTMPPSPSRPQWIPCSERLPNDYKKVLCCTFGGTQFIGYIKEAKQGEYMAVSGDSDYKTVYEIVAWMPLPEPYHRPQEGKTYE